MVQVLILANSTKLSGRCVAGVRLDTMSWVRPVGHRPGRELLLGETLAASGPKKIEVRPGDVVEMTVGQPMPTPYHPEDCGYVGEWSLVDRLDGMGVLKAVTSVVRQEGDIFGWPGVWLDPTTIAPGRESPSLELRWASVRLHPNRYDPTKIRATCDSLDLSISDPLIDHQLSGRSIEALVTVSLSEPFAEQGGRCFKLIAAVLPL